MAEDLDYVPMPDEVVEHGQEDLGAATSRTRRQARLHDHAIRRLAGRGGRAVATDRPLAVGLRLSRCRHATDGQLPGAHLQAWPMDSDRPGARERRDRAAEAADRAQALRRASRGRCGLPPSDACSAARRARHPRRRDRLRWSMGSLPAFREVRLRLPHDSSRGTRSPRSSARWRRSTARSSPRSSPC